MEGRGGSPAPGTLLGQCLRRNAIATNTAPSTASIAIPPLAPGIVSAPVTGFLISSTLFVSSLSSTRPFGRLALAGSTKYYKVWLPPFGSHVNTAVAFPVSPVVM